MATLSGNYVFDTSTLANFKNWSMAISSAFASLGWVQTADTGQVDWSTIAAVPSSAYVYEVWKAADILASTLPIYVKIGYGYSTTYLGLEITVGTGSNGSGAITGGVISSAPWVLSPLGLPQEGSSVFPCFFSGDAGEFRMYLWQNAPTSIGVVLGIERSKDASGNNSDDYFTVLAAGAYSGTSGWQQTVLSSSLVGNRELGIIAPALTSGPHTGAFNGTVASFPVFPVIGKVGNPMLGFQSCCAGDVADGSIVTVASLYGLTHTFIAASHGNFSFAVGQRGTSGTTMALLMRYE